MAVERTSGGTSLIDVLDRVLDKGIVIDAWVRVSLVGIDLITVEARVVVASIDTYLKYSEAVGAVSVTVLRPIATLGVRGGRVDSFVLDLEARNDPLVGATVGLGASVFGRNGRAAPSTPLGSGRLIAVPLQGRHTLEEYPVGLL